MINTKNRSKQSNKGLIVLIFFVILVLGIGAGTAYSTTVVATYNGEIPTGVEPIRVAIDPANGNIFASSPSSGSILKYDQSGNPLAVITGVSASLSVAVGSSGRLYVGHSGDGSVSFYNFVAGNYQYAGENLELELGNLVFRRTLRCRRSRCLAGLAVELMRIIGLPISGLPWKNQNP